MLVLSNSFLPEIGGAQYQLKWFLDCLDRLEASANSVQVHFAYPNEASGEFVEFNNIPTHDLELHDQRKSSVTRMIFRLGALLREIRPDVVHCHGVLPTGAWVMLASRIFGVKTKIVATSHGDDIVRIPEWSYGRRNSPRSRLVAKLVTKRLSAHILPSRALMQFAVDAGTPWERIVVIPNGIPTGSDFDFEAEDEADAPCGPVVSLRGAGLNFLCLSSGRAIKNLDTLIEAFGAVRSQLGGSRLLLTCDDDRIAQLIRKRGLSRDVEIIGKVIGPLKISYFRSCDVVCVVSHFESFSLTVLEGLKYGCAVVASRVGGIPEFIEHEYNGLLVSSGDPKEIGSALVRLVKDSHLRSDLVEKGLRTVERYSMNAIVDEHVRAYRQLASTDDVGAA